MIVRKKAKSYSEKQRQAPWYLIAKNKFPVFSVAFLVFLTGAYFLSINNTENMPSQKSEQKSERTFFTAPDSNPVLTPKQLILTPVVSMPVKKEETSSSDWGVSKQVAPNTWSMLVGEDKKMATSQEIFDALNNYRKQHGKNTLILDQKLTDYAQSRAESFDKAGNVDGHAGFKDFIQNQDGFNKLGFYGLGENSSIGYKLIGVHIIEWIYAGDKPHDDNQLNSSWSHVGIGVKNLSTDVVFGGRKM